MTHLNNIEGEGQDTNSYLLFQVNEEVKEFSIFGINLFTIFNDITAKYLNHAFSISIFGDLHINHLLLRLVLFIHATLKSRKLLKEGEQKLNKDNDYRRTQIVFPSFLYLRKERYIYTLKLSSL